MWASGMLYQPDLCHPPQSYIPFILWHRRLRMRPCAQQASALPKTTSSPLLTFYFVGLAKMPEMALNLLYSSGRQ